LTPTPDALFWLTIGGSIAATLAALGAKLFREYSAGDLEEYCIRKKNIQFVGEVVDHDEPLAEGAETLQAIATTTAVVAGLSWMLTTKRIPDPITWQLVSAGVLSIALILLALTHWMPLAVAKFWASPLLYHTWRFWWVVGWLAWPFTIGVRIVREVTKRLAGRHEDDEDEEEAFEDDILSMVTVGEREGFLESDAREMIEGVMDLADDDVTDVMRSRSEIDALSVDMDWQEAVDFIVKIGRTRLPVHGGSIDDIVGVLYVKDLLPLLMQPPEERQPIRELLRPAWEIPETKHLDELLQEFRQTRNHMAIVRDEYDRVAGVVTIEDVLEEIVGEIVDETDDEEIDAIEIKDEATSEIEGRAHLDEINERLGIDLPEPEDFDTIAGLVMDELGRIPKEGEAITIGDVKITVLDASRRRVEKVRLEVFRDEE